jgi:hypothetical protein
MMRSAFGFCLIWDTSKWLQFCKLPDSPTLVCIRAIHGYQLKSLWGEALALHLGCEELLKTAGVVLGDYYDRGLDITSV